MVKAAHTFSFAGYHNPERVHFGALRVLNDDSIAAGMGFSTHPHDNMEIITIPLKGDLEHKDTTGRQEVIRSGDVQIMSAGSGLYHSEKNHNKDQSLELLQIWVFPKERDIEPRYEQITFSQEAFKNKFQEIVSPRKDYEGVWINQDAYFYLGELESGISLNYDKKTKDGGAYIFLIEGSIEVDGEL
ncbi:pirin family protein [Pseudarcicella hirudinis]|uniref:pirin family protein n=1 Tax=Pseudarcicella hirudinis TaxID=1079859 RepID=UPI0035E924B8